MATLLDKLNSELKASEAIVETHTLELEWFKQGPPTKTGLARKLVKFKELTSPVYVLASCINGKLSNGGKYPVELSSNDKYTNVIGIQGTRSEKMDNIDYAQSVGMNLSI